MENDRIVGILEVVIRNEAYDWLSCTVGIIMPPRLVHSMNEYYPGGYDVFTRTVFQKMLNSSVEYAKHTIKMLDDTE